MSAADDGVLWSEHERQLQLERAHAERLASARPRIARIQARRDIQVARASSSTYTDRVIARCIALTISVFIIGFFAVIAVQAWGPDPKPPARGDNDAQMWHDCLAKGNEPYYDHDGINCH